MLVQFRVMDDNDHVAKSLVDVPDFATAKRMLLRVPKRWRLLAISIRGRVEFSYDRNDPGNAIDNVTR
jgi:hypothetical protein